MYGAVRGHRGFPHVYGVKEVTLDGQRHTGLHMQALGPGMTAMQQQCSNGRVPQEYLVIVARKALERIRAMHRAEYLHRDVKPDNLVLGANGDGELYLIDMGLATRFVADSGVIIPPRHRPGTASPGPRGSRRCTSTRAT